MKGCYIYCADHELQDYMKKRLAAYCRGVSQTAGSNRFELVENDGIGENQ